MRSLVAFLLAAVPAAAQTGPFVAEVSADSVPVRCGPTDQMPETGQLFRGTQVVVDHEEPGGWVAIEPPRGQVSWIKHLYLDEPSDAIPRNSRVHADPDVAIAYGKPGAGRPFDVERTRIPDGTAVLVIGKKVEHRGSVWYPIEPPAGDFRYVPRSAVRAIPGKAAATFVVKSPPPAADPAADPVPATASIRPVSQQKGSDWPNHPLWQQAEKAERAGEYGNAETLYLKLAGEMNRPGGDGELANLCYTRVHTVREKQRQPGAKDGGAKGAPDWVGPGSLRPAGFRIDNRQTFALVGESGQVKCYAVAGPGVDLDRYRGFDVEIYGPTTYPGDLRGVGVVTSTGVRLFRDK